MPGMGKPDEAGPVLVTGASGFIGRALAARLEQTGRSVVRISRAHGFDIVRDGLPLDGVRHVFHLAARTGVAESWDEPVAYFDANALGTARVLEQCRRHGCGMTFLSAYVYGPPQRLPIAETEPVEPNNPYALSKSIGEQLCAFYSRFYGLPVVALRAFNVYGPGQRDDFLIPLIVKQILDPLQSEVVVMDLRPRRDYVYISDALEAILLASRAASGSVFNVGSGAAYSVQEIIERASAAAGIFKPYRALNERRRNEIEATVADIRALSEAVGWRPEVTIDQGLVRVIESMRGTCQKST